ncbi:MAG: GNAT family N-acetyltransferase [Lachnospiraceae bacterium]|jgi:GNAT superfamily N-acetyltransferase|nr:GNAT family N-acetyltransferase [Lachnospiraceae bacterium]MCH4030524.1 GNAT family N-acetyltransferase [Lachnospiraceae bacterium]MCH4069734.1 GNAT family N-acetyltransferase [Lachnospiraceae bacterium]MCH4107328.1 GNAT family N-acetyltransferase [Lachnospiraceae bacterium]MCI1301818.1 GNAT family N-acetyltransferase [Lachnospiraceae bacterium]
MEIRTGIRDVGTYLSLRESVGWIRLTRAQAQKALAGSLEVFTVFDGERPIGMARLVGDGAVVSYVQDLIIVPEYQGQRIGSLLLDTVTRYVRENMLPGTRMMFDLMCRKGMEEFYLKHGFTARPTKNLGPGMIEYIYKYPDGSTDIKNF